MSPHPKFMLPGKKLGTAKCAIIQPTGCWCRTCPQHSKSPAIQGAVWKRARSNFSDSPRHLEVKVAELQLKKVIFLNSNRQFLRQKKKRLKTGRFGRRGGLKGSFSPTTHSKLIYEPPPPRLTTHCSIVANCWHSR